MPAARVSLPCPPAHGFPFPFQAPVNRPQCQPPFLQAEQCFRPAPAVYEQVYRPQQCLLFHDAASFANPSLQPPCAPHMMRPFHSFSQRYTIDASSSIRQPFFVPPCPEPQHLQSLQGLPHTGELNAPVVSMGFEGIAVRSSSESVLSRQATPGQASEICAVPEAVQIQSKPVLPNSNKDVDIVSEKSRESLSSCVKDGHKSESDHERQRDRRRRYESERSRRRERSLHRDKPRDSALDNR